MDSDREGRAGRPSGRLGTSLSDSKAPRTQVRGVVIETLPSVMYKVRLDEGSLVFYDYGLASIKHLLDGEDKSTELSSYGVGARWQIKENLSAHFDYGWQIEHLGRDHSRGHVGVTLSF